MACVSVVLAIPVLLAGFCSKHLPQVRVSVLMPKEQPSARGGWELEDKVRLLCTSVG